MNPGRRRALRLLLAWGEPFLIPGGRFVVTGHGGVFSARVQARTRRRRVAPTRPGQRGRRRGAGSGLRAACLPVCLPAAAYGAKERRGGKVPAVPCGRWAGLGRSSEVAVLAACSVARSLAALGSLKARTGEGPICSAEPEGILRLSCQEGGGRKRSPLGGRTSSFWPSNAV